MASNFEKMRESARANRESSNTLSSASLSNFSKMAQSAKRKQYNFDTIADDEQYVRNNVLASYNGWQDKNTLNLYKNNVSDMVKRLDAYREVNGSNAGVDSIINYYNKALENWDQMASIYGSYADADSYNKAVKNAKLSEQYNGASYDTILKDKAKRAGDADFFNSFTNYGDAESFEKAIANASDDDYRKKLEGAYQNYKDAHAWDNYKGLMDSNDFSDTVANVNKIGILEDKYPFQGELIKTNRGTEAEIFNKMNEDEKQVAVYIYKKEGIEGLANYLDSMGMSVGKRSYDEKVTKEAENIANTDGIAGVGLNTWYSLRDAVINAVGSAGATGEVLGSYLGGGEYNPYLGASGLTNLSGATTSAISEEIKDFTSPVLGNSQFNLASMGYNALVSDLASKAGQYVFGAAYTPLMGGGAYASTYKDAIERGIDRESAKKTALAAGAAEVLFEYISLGELKGLQTENTDSLKTALLNMAKQFVGEGSEEVATDIANMVSDYVINGDMSEISGLYQSYLDAGYSADQASIYTALAKGQDVLESFIVGGMSGAMGAGVMSARGYANNKQIGANADRYLLEKTISGNEDLQNRYKEANTDAKLGRFMGDVASESLDSTHTALANYIKANNSRVSDRQADRYAEQILNGKITYKNVAYAVGAQNDKDFMDLKNSNSKLYSGIDASVRTAKQKMEDEKRMEKFTINNDADLKKITDIKDDKVTVNGEVKPISEVVMNTEQAIVVDNASILSDAEKNVYLDVYRGQESEAYDTAFRMVWEDAQNNVPIEDTYEKFKTDALLSEHEIDKIYSASAKVRSEQGAINAKVRNEAYAEIKKNFKAGKFDTSELDKKNVNLDDPAVKTAYHIAQTFSMLGANVRLVYDISSPNHKADNGFYTSKDKTVTINLAAKYNVKDTVNKGYAINTIAHEFTHFMQDELGKDFDALTNALKRIYGESKWNALIKEQNDLFGVRGDEAIAEVVARACEDMLNNPDTMEQILQKMEVNEIKSLKDAVKKFFDKLIELWNKVISTLDLNSNSTAAKMLREEMANYEEIRKMWIDMMAQALKEVQNANDIALKEYVTSTSAEVLDYIENTLNNQKRKRAINIEDSLPSDLVNDIKYLTGVDVSDFGNEMSAETVFHIWKRHGKNGNQDHSMENKADIARIQYAIEHYQKIGNAGFDNYIRDKNDKPSPKVMLQTKIGDSFYYVVEAVPDSKVKKIKVITAYKNKNDVLSQEAVDIIPRQNVRNDLEPSTSSNTIIDGVLLKSKQIDPKNIPAEKYDEMKSHFGTTTNFNVAGYMLKDGTMLDFSGKHWGDTSSTFRQVDHRDVQEVLEDTNKTNGVGSMITMISNGNIRLMPENGGINLSEMPNEAQMKVLERYIQNRLTHDDRMVIVDFDEKGGDTVYSKLYEAGVGVSTQSIIRDIVDYYENGIKSQSTVAQFHNMYSKQLDSEGNALTEEISSRTVDSKIRDKDGKLIALYHGTDAEFDAFKPHAATGWGRGIYLASNKEDAKNYGRNLVKVYANITNPYTSSDADIEKLRSEGKLTKAFIDWEKEFAKEMYKDDVYDDEEYAEILDDIKAGEWSYDPDDEIVDVNTLNQVIRELGYDGIMTFASNDITGYEVVAFDSNQVIIESKSKLYSKQLDSDYMKAVESGDEEEQRRIIEQAARDAGYNIRAYHGTNAQFNVFSYDKLGSKNFLAPSASMGFFAAKSRETAEAYIGLNSADIASLAFSSEAAESMERIKKAHNFDKVNEKYLADRDKFFDKYRNEHGFKEAVTNIVDALSNNEDFFKGLEDKKESMIKEMAQSLEYRWNDTNLNPMFDAWNETPIAKKYEEFEEEISSEWEKEELDRRGYTPNVKNLYIKMEKPFVYDFNGEGRDTESFASRMAEAKKNGYDGCIFLNVADGAEIDDIYTVFSNTQLKSADLITYDDSGKIILPSERFKSDNSDIRYSKQIRDDSENKGEIAAMNVVNRTIREEHHKPLSKLEYQELKQTIKSEVKEHYRKKTSLDFSGFALTSNHIVFYESFDDVNPQVLDALTLKEVINDAYGFIWVCNFAHRILKRNGKFSGDDREDIVKFAESVRSRAYDRIMHGTREFGQNLNGSKSVSKGLKSRQLDDSYVKLSSTKLGFTDERIDELTSGSWYGSSNPSYAQAYIAYMSPDDYLKLTTGKNQRALDRIKNWEQDDDFNIGKMAEEYNHVPIQLNIDEEEREVIGHEGRHRMWQLKQLGYTEIPVLLFNYQNKYSKKAISSIDLMPQWFQALDDSLGEPDRVTVRELVPLSSDPRYKEFIKKKFGSESGATVFSRQLDDTAYEILGEKERVEKDFDRVASDMERLATAINGKNINITKSQIEAAVDSIKKMYKSTYNDEDFKKELTSLYRFIANGASATDILGRAYDIAGNVLGNQKSNISPDFYYRNLLSEIRGTKVSLSKEQIASAVEEYGSDYRNSFMGNVILAKNGTPLTEMWKEWSNKYPDIFKADVNEADMLIALGKALDSVKQGKMIVESYRNQELRLQLARDIYNKFWNITDVREATKDIFREHSKVMSEMHNDYSARVEKGMSPSDWKKVINKVSKQRDKKLSDYKEYVKKRKGSESEAQEKRILIKQITDVSKDMLDWMNTNSKDKHVPDALKPAVKALLDAINFSSRQMYKTGNPTMKDISFVRALENMHTIFKNNAEELTTENGFSELDLTSDFADEMDKLYKAVNEVERNVHEDNGYILQEMSKEDLERLYTMVKALKKSISQMNKFIASSNNHSMDAVAEMTIEHANELGQSKMPEAISKFDYGEGLPYYVFQRMGEGGRIVFENLMDGQDKMAFRAREIQRFAEDTYTDKEAVAWEKEIKDFKFRDYEFSMTVPQIMSLYCLMKREQARGHILSGGLRVDKFKDGLKTINQTQTLNLSELEINEIINSLTDRQIEVADALQNYMNTTCADWGNEVTMKRFDIKGFTEKNYFPIRVNDKKLKNDPKDKNASLYALLNLSFTKKLTIKANNEVMVENVFDVFANHASDMARYNSMALPVLDLIRWWNYKVRVDKESGHEDVTVKSALETAYGDEMNKYIRRLVDDINGTKERGRMDSMTGKLFTAYKVAAVGANLQVALLQPISYFRALYKMDGKYLRRALSRKPDIKSARENVGMMVWKDMGFFELDVTRGLTSIIKHDGGVMDDIREWSMKPAEMGDTLTWGFIWNACEEEIKDTRKDLAVGSDEFKKAVAHRMRELIYSTQVVDSVLTRSQYMRGGDMYSKMLTAFLSEPTLSLNTLRDAAERFSQDAKRYGKMEAFKRNKKNIYRAVGAYIICSVVESALRSAIGKIRDTDDEEEIQLLFLEHLREEMLIHNKMPLFKDIASIAQGYSPTRMDESAIQQAVWTFKDVLDGDWDYDTLYKSLKLFSQTSGLPVSNATREVVSIWNFTIGNANSNLIIK